MTYDQWFKSQQGVAYDSMWSFARVAWGEQQQRIDDQAAMIQQMALEYISDQGQWIDEIGRLKGEVARYETLCDQLGEALHAASYALTYDVPKVEVAIAAWREMKGGCDVPNSE